MVGVFVFLEQRPMGLTYRFRFVETIRSTLGGRSAPADLVAAGIKHHGSIVLAQTTKMHCCIKKHVKVIVMRLFIAEKPS
jgi:hypothetical protein